MAEASIDLAETKRSGQVEQDGKGQKRSFDEIDETKGSGQDGNGHELSFDEIREETLTTEQQVLTIQTQLTAFCDLCFLLNYTKNSALYLCYLCKQYLCASCRKSHEQSHSMVEKESEGDERDRQNDSFLDEMMEESESERMEMFNREDVSLVDRFSVKHELDKSDDYWINGICGLDGTRWVISDSFNDCIKVFSIGSHILQRYIRLGSRPWGVTAINVEQELTSRVNVQKVKPLKHSDAINTLSSVKRKPTEQGVMVTSDISEPNQSKPDKQCLIAVTLPLERRILFINLTPNPAVLTNSIETKKHCRDIAFSGDQIVTVCGDYKYPSVLGPWFITVLSTGGVELKTINTPRDIQYDPSLAVCPGRFYLTDWGNGKVLCMNYEGKVVFSSNTIRWSGPVGVSVDPDTEKVYIIGWDDSTLSRLDSRLESLESLFKFNEGNVGGGPFRLCVYRDRVYVSHGPWGSPVVSVVRVI